jgi:hypothetical protein
MIRIKNAAIVHPALIAAKTVNALGDLCAFLT